MATDSFFNRWSKRKLHQATISEDVSIDKLGSDDKTLPSALQPESDSELSTTLTRNQTASPAESVTEESLATANEISTLLVSASAELKKKALRQLFFNGEFNQVDGLDDYDGDYHALKPLASELAQSVREWLIDVDPSNVDLIPEHQSEHPNNHNHFAHHQPIMPRDRMDEDETALLDKK
ncbi:DUF3306 domain-containing protein [Vibrio metschnikovii]|uniref:DUF3306 domain-containing protein n=1 Tax=Vibrio metschnikovii TaxID=28172 RepID=UPI001C2F5CC2|nr:DUF3306 domain-containing protein [Vibrio metschnikovii]MDA3138949.1 DUF3306 domain-containing protein [Vibrio metschnikovii]